MKLVSDQTTNVVEANKAAARVRARAAAVAVNVLRIVAGAGKPADVIDEIALLFEAFEDLVPFSRGQEYPYAPHTAIAEGMRDFDWRLRDAGYQSHPMEKGPIDYCVSDIAKFALRWRAAQLAAQPTQEASSFGDLVGSVRQYPEARKTEWDDPFESFQAQQKAQKT